MEINYRPSVMNVPLLAKVDVGQDLKVGKMPFGKRKHSIRRIIYLNYYLSWCQLIYCLNILL